MPKSKRGSAKQQMRSNITDFGWCRANQHIWVPPSRQDGQALRVDRGVISAVFVCNQCSGERHDAISLRTGELLTRFYKMPQGYYLKYGKNEERPTKSDWRREHYRELMK